MASPVLRVTLIRHGQSANNVLLDQSFAAFTSARTPDAPLTPEGVAQALLAGRFLAAAQPQAPVPLTALYASGMDRALHTAAVVGECVGLRPVVWPDCHEVGGCFANELDAQGELVGYRGVPGMGRGAIAARYQQVLLPAEADGPDDPSVVGGALTGDGWWHHPHREAEVDAIRRINRVLRALKRRAWSLGVAAAAAADSRAFADVDAPPSSVATRGLAPALARGFATSDALLAAQIATAQAGPDCCGHRVRLVPGEAPESEAPAPIRRAAAQLARVGGMWATGAPSAPAASPASPAPSAAGSEGIAIVCHGDMIDVLLRLAVGALEVDDRTGRVVDRFHPSPSGADRFHAPAAGGGGGAGAPGDPTPDELFGFGFDAPTALPGGDGGASAAAARRADAAAVFAAAAGHTAPPLRFVSHNCGLTVLDISPSGAVKVVRVNDVRHLAALPASPGAGAAAGWLGPAAAPGRPDDLHDDDAGADGDRDGSVFAAADAATAAFMVDAACAFGLPWGPDRSDERAAFAACTPFPIARLTSPLLTAGAASLV